jgi:hypothetical protein
MLEGRSTSQIFCLYRARLSHRIVIKGMSLIKTKQSKGGSPLQRKTKNLPSIYFKGCFVQANPVLHPILHDIKLQDSHEFVTPSDPIGLRIVRLSNTDPKLFLAVKNLGTSKARKSRKDYSPVIEHAIALAEEVMNENPRMKKPQEVTLEIQDEVCRYAKEEGYPLSEKNISDQGVHKTIRKWISRFIKARQRTRELGQTAIRSSRGGMERLRDER